MFPRRRLRGRHGQTRPPHRVGRRPPRRERPNRSARASLPPQLAPRGHSEGETQVCHRRRTRTDGIAWSMTQGAEGRRLGAEKNRRRRQCIAGREIGGGGGDFPAPGGRAHRRRAQGGPKSTGNRARGASQDPHRDACERECAVGVGDTGLAAAVRGRLVGAGVASIIRENIGEQAQPQGVSRRRVDVGRVVRLGCARVSRDPATVATRKRASEAPAKRSDGSVTSRAGAARSAATGGDGLWQPLSAHEGRAFSASFF